MRSVGGTTVRCETVPEVGVVTRLEEVVEMLLFPLRVRKTVGLDLRAHKSVSGASRAQDLAFTHLGPGADVLDGRRGFRNCSRRHKSGLNRQAAIGSYARSFIPSGRTSTISSGLFAPDRYSSAVMLGLVTSRVGTKISSWKYSVCSTDRRQRPERQDIWSDLVAPSLGER